MSLRFSNPFGRCVGTFYGVRVFEAPTFRCGAGLALPGVGIVVYPGAFSEKKDMDLVRHEFGHMLQACRFGYAYFYTKIAPQSLLSAAGKGKHRLFWTEIAANRLAYEYFGRPENWPISRFPLDDFPV